MIQGFFLRVRASATALKEWAHLQLLDDGPRLFYNDIHEYFLYMLCVPYVPEDIKASCPQTHSQTASQANLSKSKIPESASPPRFRDMEYCKPRQERDIQCRMCKGPRRARDLAPAASAICDFRTHLDARGPSNAPGT